MLKHNPPSEGRVQTPHYATFLIIPAFEGRYVFRSPRLFPPKTLLLFNTPLGFERFADSLCSGSLSTPPCSKA